ncbi:UNVERIFIED_CONTAM: hypothetical protein FKN15_032082 [Acipenser sinensis]
MPVVFSRKACGLEARQKFRSVLVEATVKLDELVKKIGKAVEESKPYWEARRVARQVFLPVLYKRQVSPHQEVYHSSHPETNDRSLKVCGFIQLSLTRLYTGLHLVGGGAKFLEDQQLPKCKAKSLHLIIMFAAA